MKGFPALYPILAAALLPCAVRISARSTIGAPCGYPRGSHRFMKKDGFTVCFQCKAGQRWSIEAEECQDCDGGMTSCQPNASPSACSQWTCNPEMANPQSSRRRQDKASGGKRISANPSAKSDTLGNGIVDPVVVPVNKLEADNEDMPKNFSDSAADQNELERHSMDTLRPKAANPSTGVTPLTTSTEKATTELRSLSTDGRHVGARESILRTTSASKILHPYTSILIIICAIATLGLL